MRRIIISDMISADGFFAGPNGEINWHVVDAEFNEYAADLLGSADLLIFGRVTYDLMAGYWPRPEIIKNDPIIAERMNNLPKMVFSKTQGKLTWNNSKVASEIVLEEIIKMKQQPGKDMLILGSGTIVAAFAQAGLIDEYRLIVNPVILGNGRTLFKDINPRIKLKLKRTKTFDSGNVLLCYEPVALNR